jgi:glycosyltransferase involved in cell wall biosynthesis
MNCICSMNHHKAQHTFVILAHKESRYLRECIDSVRKQSIQNKVLIATSTPNPFISALAEEYGIDIHVNPKGGSIGKDWNFGYSCADTKYVTLAHQDDIYLPWFAEHSIIAAEKHKNEKPLILFNKSLVFKGEKQLALSYKNILRWLLIFPFHFKKSLASKALKKSILLFSNSISCPGVFYVKENLGDFKFDEEAKFVLDWKAWHDMSQRKGAFIYIPEVLHIHREHADSATSSTHSEVLQKEEVNLLTTIWNNKMIASGITTILRITK